MGNGFCYVSNSAGIQKADNGQSFSGTIKPRFDKFVITISERSDSDKRLACDWNEYGIANSLGLSGRYGNLCLANFKIEFSPELDVVLNYSSDSYKFGGQGSFGTNFVLYGNGDFTLFTAVDGNTSYVSHGRCEKIN